MKSSCARRVASTLRQTRARRSSVDPSGDKDYHSQFGRVAFALQIQSHVYPVGYDGRAVRRFIDGYIICILVNNLQRISLDSVFWRVAKLVAECAVKLYILSFL